MGRIRFKRASWFFKFMQASISSEEVGCARELAHLLMVVDMSPGDDDKRVDLALHLANMNPPSGDLVEVEAQLKANLSAIREVLNLQFQLLLAGQELSLSVPARFQLRLEGPVSGGLSCPEIKENIGEFCFSTSFSDVDLMKQVQVNFVLSLAGMHRDDVGKCPECGRFFVVARKGNVFCSPKCASVGGMRKKRQQLKREDPDGYALHLENERKRSHEKYVARVKRQTPGARVEQRPRRIKKEEE